MSVKEDVLRILNENKETYLSGAQIAEKLQISRTAVWKAVKSLNEEGYNMPIHKTQQPQHCALELFLRHM